MNQNTYNDILASDDNGDGIVFDINKEDGTTLIMEFYKGDKLRFEDLINAGDNGLGKLLAQMGTWDESGTVFTKRLDDNELSLTIDGEAVMLDITMNGGHQTIVLHDFTGKMHPMDDDATQSLLQNIIMTAG